MTDQEKKNLRIYCAFLLVEYGFHFSPSDPVIPALYIIHRQMERNNQQSQKLGVLITEAASKIKPESYHFHEAGEALKFQLGIAMKWTIVGSVLALIVWGAAWHWSARNDVAKAKVLLETSTILQRVRVDGNNRPYLDSKDFKMIDSKTVRVYLTGKSQ